MPLSLSSHCRPTGELPLPLDAAILARARVILLLVLLLVAGPTLTLAPGRRGGPAACTTGGAAAAEVPAGAGVVTGAAGNVAEHVVHESALLGDAVVEVSRDVHLASAVRGLLADAVTAVVVVVETAGEASN